MSGAAWFVRDVLHGGDTGASASLVRAALAPLSVLHRAGLEAYLFPFHIGLRRRFRLPVPVISIGNLTSGGTGKTPATALVAGYLCSLGKRVVVLSRGHGGAGERASAPRVVSDGERTLLSPTDAGDEPVLLASLLPGVPVIVCRDRRRSGRLAVERFAPDVIVLDDGLQYWQLHRDLDIVLLDARRPFDNGCLLPRGLLREPPSHLARAGAVILTRADRASEAELAASLRAASHFARPGVPVLTATHAPTGWHITGATTAEPATLLRSDALRGQTATVFSGIADGAAFADTVRGLGVAVREVVSFADHHAYTAEDWANIRARAAAGNREETILVTTEKDAVKIAGFASGEGVVCYALRVALSVRGEGALFEIIGHSLGQ